MGMNEQLKRYIDPVRSFWSNLTKKKQIVLLSCAGGIVILAIVVAVLLSATPYVVLYPDLDSEEAAAVVNELKDRDVSFREEDGTIYVPQDQENALRMELANLGYPQSAPNYDFFTQNVDVMTTDYEKKIIEKYQLNQRLEAVIETFDAVSKASVTINIPDDGNYAWDTDQKISTASVAITMKAGKKLDAGQINGIKQLISKSVPNLKPEDVAVIDTATGQEMNSESVGANSTVDISEFKLAIEHEYEDGIEASVRKVLAPIYGEENVQVTAKAIMDVDKKVREAVTYTPSQDNKGVISKENTNSEQERGGTSSAGGAPGAETNADTPGYAGVTVDGDTIYVKDEKSYEYLVSSVKEQVQSDAASVQDLTVSVAVNRDMMSDTEKTQVTKLIAFAAAIDPAKVAVFNSAFLTAETPVPQDYFAWLTGPIGWAILAACGLFFLIMLILLLVSRHRKKKLQKLLAEAQEQARQAEEQARQAEIQSEVNLSDGIDDETEKAAGAARGEESAEDAAARERRELEELHAAQQNRSQELRKSLQDFSDQNPEIVAQLIKSWLRGEDEADG